MAISYRQLNSVLILFWTLLNSTQFSTSNSLIPLARVESYVTTDGQSASLSWIKAPIWGVRPDFYHSHTVAVLRMWGALSDERTGPPFAIVAGLARAVILGYEFRGTLDHILLFQIRNFPFRRLLRLAITLATNRLSLYNLGSDPMKNIVLSCRLLLCYLAMSCITVHREHSCYFCVFARTCILSCCLAMSICLTIYINVLIYSIVPLWSPPLATDIPCMCLYGLLLQSQLKNCPVTRSFIAKISTTFESVQKYFSLVHVFTCSRVVFLTATLPCIFIGRHSRVLSFLLLIREVQDLNLGLYIGYLCFIMIPSSQILG
jgi:hypothetical protein